MSETTPNLLLPFILPSQAQKHVTHNEALRMLDALLQLSVLSRSLLQPPSLPREGERYLLPANTTGEWADYAGQIAAFIDTQWFFFIPQAGWLAYIADEARQFLFDGVQWRLPSLNPVERVGINTSADDVNRLALASDAALFTHVGAGHQLKINKNLPADTASLLFQSGWSGYAEMGLAGENNFNVKVADDAGEWRQALRIDRATGNIAVGSVWPSVALHVDGAIRPASYVLASLPSAVSFGAGALIYVSNAGTGVNAGGQLAYSDGSAWRKLRDGSSIAA